MKSHFKQKSATELYQELSVLRQEANESPQDFLVRALNLKQQIIFVSNATAGSIKYGYSLVQVLFLHVVEIGLQDESVRAKLRPSLEVASVTNEQLMERVNRIMSAEAEHQNKMGVADRKGARVNQVGTASSLSNQTQPSSGLVPRLFKREVNYLGQIVSAAGYRLDHSNVEAVRTLKDSKPSTVGEVRKLLGLLGYYRRYIQNFAKIAHPLLQLLQATSEDVTKLARKSKQHSNHDSVPPSRPVIWTEQHQKAVETLLDHLVSPPILGYPDFSKSFVLHTASQEGLGAVLYQKQDGKMRVIGYGSRSLTKAEKNYYLHSGKL